MYTNQAAIPGDPAAPGLGCDHQPGAATTANCRYLRVVERMTLCLGRARDAHLAQRIERPMLGELWQLQAELFTALDHCPNARVYQEMTFYSCATLHERTL
jgi:hypothetical protein